MNYKHIHDNIINNARTRTLSDLVYCEYHHIVPKCLGGSNNSDNIVALTAKEHFVVHHLLWKIHSGKEKRKMMYAFFALCFLHNSNNQSRFKTNAKTFSQIREAYANSRKSTSFTQEHRKKLSEAKRNSSQSPESNKKRSAAMQGVQKTEEHKTNIAKSKLGNKNPRFGKSPWNKGIPMEQSKRAELSQKLSHVKRRISICGVEYASISEASRILNIHISTIFGKLNSKNEDYFYV